MTKEITKAIILQEIQNKFRLRALEPEVFTFGEFVVPTYDIGAHAKNWVTVEDRFAVAATSDYSCHEIPENERWYVRRLDILHETGANFDIDQILFYNTATKHQYLFYDQAAPITTGQLKIFTPTQDVVMEYDQLQKIVIHVDNYVAGGYISVNMLREVEVLR